MSNASVERYHALDALRGFAMMLGIVLHVGIAYMVQSPAFWPVHDTQTTLLADFLLFAVHDFRMQLFYLVAGFFSAMLYFRHGHFGLLKHRLRRVAVPFVLSLLFIVPTLQAVGLYAELHNVRRGQPTEGHSVREYAAQLITAKPDASSIELVLDFFTCGEFVTRLPLAHLWFLYYLLIFIALATILAPILRRLSGTRLLARFDAAFRDAICGRWRQVVLPLLTLPAMLTMRWAVDTPSSWRPLWHVLAYYFGFFAFGWALYRHRDLVERFGRGWLPNLVVANLVFLPLMVFLVIRGFTAEKAGDENILPLKCAASLVSASYTWLMITSLWGAFAWMFSKPVAWVRYLADSAYWCYLASITPILVLQFLVAPWDIPAELKIVLVTAATMILLLASYEWGVRYTFVGAILNGRKNRVKHETSPKDLVEARQ